MKKILSICAAIIMGLCLFCGCSSSENYDRKGSSENIRGETCALREAYEKGYLSKTDLEAIAYFHNNQIAYPEPLDSEIDNQIRDALAEMWRTKEDHPEANATKDDFKITKFLGVFNNCYVVDVLISFIVYPAMPGRKWEIDGVEFCEWDCEIKVYA